MPKKAFFLLITPAVLFLGIGLGWVLRGFPQKPPPPLSAAQCDIGPLFYQVQNSVSDEHAEMQAYPSNDRYYGKPALVDFSTAPDAKKFYTRLTEGARQGPNAAGHYTIIQIGSTGNGYFTYIVDARTGKIIVDGQLENSQWKYAIESDLIVADGIANPAYFYGPPNEPTPEFAIKSRLLLLRDGKLKKFKNLPWIFGTHNYRQITR